LISLVNNNFHSHPQDTSNLVKKVKLNNEERHKNEPIKLQFEEKTPEKKVVEPILETIPLEIPQPVRLKILDKGKVEVLEKEKKDMVEEKQTKSVSYFESDSDAPSDEDSDYEKETPMFGLFEPKKKSPFLEIKEIDEESEKMAEFNEEFTLV
jgi:hypothetical protein